jgi:tetratricopeptide (TPR) repeat protein
MPQSWLLPSTKNMVRIRAAFVAVVATVSLSACAEYRGATDYLIAGNEAFQRNDYKQAEIEYRNALKLEPNSETALNNLGVILNELGKTDEAIEILRKAISIQQTNIIAHYTLSQALAKKGDLDGAIAEAKAALAQPKANQELGAHRALAQASLLKAKRDKDQDALKVAIDEFHTIIQNESDDADAHFGLGEALLVSDDKEGALAEVKKAVDLNPDLLAARKVLAQMYIDAGQKDDAAKELKTVLSKDPSDAEARKLQAEVGGGGASGGTTGAGAAGAGGGTAGGASAPPQGSQNSANAPATPAEPQTSDHPASP